MRICIYGTAGAGKSTTAAELFAQLKSRHYNVELVTEYIKTWAYQGRRPESWDQFYVFGKQLHREDVALRHVDHIVTDCPLLMITAYSEYYGFEGTDEIRSLANKFEAKYPSINIYLHKIHPYQPAGRYQTEEQANQAEIIISRVLMEHIPSDRILQVRHQFTDILGWVLEKIDPCE